MDAQWCIGSRRSVAAPYRAWRHWSRTPCVTSWLGVGSGSGCSWMTMWESRRSRGWTRRSRNCGSCWLNSDYGRTSPNSWHQRRMWISWGSGFSLVRPWPGWRWAGQPHWRLPYSQCCCSAQWGVQSCGNWLGCWLLCQRWSRGAGVMCHPCGRPSVGCVVPDTMGTSMGTDAGVCSGGSST